jgi:RNA polymerase sigma-70 factor (ECF subfamily)
MDLTDAEALARARAGDTDAFRVLVERHSRSLFRLAFRLTGSEADAEDVVQEAFLKAYRRLEQFEERAAVGSWLYRIAANVAYDLLRARRRAPHTADAAGAEEDEPPALPSEEPGPERLAISSDVRRQVGWAMKRMTLVERSAFVLRHFEGLSIQEIGSALELSTNATKQSLLRAVRKLRRALEPPAGVTT